MPVPYVPYYVHRLYLLDPAETRVTNVRLLYASNRALPLPTAHSIARRSEKAAATPNSEAPPPMLDENGQPLSKNEQKRRLKELERQKKAAEKAAAKAVEPAKDTKPKTDVGPALEEEEEDIDPTKV